MPSFNPIIYWFCYLSWLLEKSIQTKHRNQKAAVLSEFFRMLIWWGWGVGGLTPLMLTISFISDIRIYLFHYNSHDMWDKLNIYLTDIAKNIYCSLSKNWKQLPPPSISRAYITCPFPVHPSTNFVILVFNFIQYIYNIYHVALCTFRMIMQCI